MNKQEEFDKIDRKLDKLLRYMDYSDYVAFIKGNKVLKEYDWILGGIDTKTTSSGFYAFLTEEVIIEVNRIIDEKLKELNLD